VKTKAKKTKEITQIENSKEKRQLSPPLLF
jgi:hypothetical protein